MTFDDLHLTAPILRAAAESGYETPSPIQAAAIPPVLAGRDVLGCAQTGTGKTAAFAMPILQRLDGKLPRGAKRPIRALILTPTRELALQIDESFTAYGKHLPLRSCVIFGGVGQAPQVETLKKGVDILTATPGRLNDLIGQGYIDLSSLEIFVLDEADRMLDMGFVHDVKRVIAKLPAKRQTLLFSATMPREIEELAGTILTRPEKIMVTPPATTVEAIEQSVYFVDKGNKRHLLASLLQSPDIVSALVFTRTKHGADRVVRELARAGIAAMAIHGNKSQNARQDALAKFKDGRIRVLVATDIAARGIDVSGLSHVFNYDLPNIPETYVHRIGRTGRAGHAGVAISFCDAEELPYLADIEKLTHIHIPPVDHAWPMTEAEPPLPPVRRGAAQQTAGRKSRPKEEMTVEQTADARQPQKEKAATGEKKRRRGGRRHRSAAQTAAAQVENGAAAQTQKAAQPAKQAPADKQKNAGQKQGAEQAKQPRQTKPEQKNEPRGEQKNDQRKKQGKAAKPSAPQPSSAQNAKAASGGKGAANGKAASSKNDRTAKQNKTAAPRSSEPERDDSIQLIARRAPAQKYASFEEYMKAHGGT